jgi:hypothetical protein
MVNKWVKAVEACAGKEGEELTECYKSAVEWHHHGFMGKDNAAWKDVDWETVKAAKMGFFERAKKLQSVGEVRPLAAGLRAEFVKAGVPEDHADSWVSKMVEAVVKDFDGAQSAHEGATDTECAKYEGKSELAVRGCSKCAEYYPGRVDQCMTCGGVCGRKVCDENNFGECVKTEPFIECHRSCMAEEAIAPENKPYLKLLRLQRLFSALYHKLFDLFEQYFL